MNTLYRQSLLLLSALLFSSLALAAKGTKIQLMCEAKAKEIAQSAYTDCIQESKSAELEKIKQDYQAKSQQLKAYYEKRIRALGGGKNKRTPKTQVTDSPSQQESTSNADSPAETEYSTSFKETVTPEKIETSEVKESEADEALNSDFQ